MFNTVTNIDSQNSNFIYNDENDENDNDNDSIDKLNNETKSNESTILPILNSNNTNNETYSDLEIKKFIDNFTEDQQIEIFKIIKYYKEYYSSNNNGIFINLDNISNDCKKEMIQFINFSKQKTQSLQKMENYMDKFKQCLNSTENNS
jgi:hypothetical protein